MRSRRCSMPARLAAIWGAIGGIKLRIYLFARGGDIACGRKQFHIHPLTVLGNPRYGFIPMTVLPALQSMRNAQLTRVLPTPVPVPVTK